MKTVMLAVGISDYASEKIPDLAVCHLDAQKMVETWQTLAGGQLESRLLINEQATKSGIETGLRWLADTVGPGDLALFYYSGHGASFEDEDSDEEDRRDEFLCPHDCGMEIGVQSFIRDDEIKEHLAAVSQKTDRVVLIFDSCHSGSAQQAPLQAIAKEIDPGVMRQLLGATPLPPASPPASATAAAPILMAGCQDPQQSYILNGWEHSLFTAALLKALEDPAIKTFQQLFAAAASEVQDHADLAGINQTPNLIDGSTGEIAFRQEPAESRGSPAAETAAPQEPSDSSDR